jgi:hypothetical protein
LLLHLDVRLTQRDRNCWCCSGAADTAYPALVHSVVPSENGRTSDKDASFPLQFFHITTAQDIPQAPSHYAEDEVGFKVVPFEKGRIAQSW